MDFPTSQWFLPCYRSQVNAVVRAGLEPDKQPLWTWDQSLITPTRLFKTYKTHLTFEVRKLRLMFFALEGADSNRRTQWEQIYSLPVLTTHPPSNMRNPKDSNPN